MQRISHSNSNMPNNPQLILKGRYQVVPRTIIFIIRDDQVLLQKGAENKKIYPGFLNGIGGHLERMEDVLSGARRELYEEANISCEDLRLAGTIMIDVEETQGILLFVLTGEELTGEPQGSEEGSLLWVPIHQLNEVKTVDDIPELVGQILNFKKTGRLFFGKYVYSEDGRRIATFHY